jgi:diguanylate cyclase
VTDAVDWKKKHFDALREIEAEERRWRDLEQILRRLVQRLCTIGRGGDARLDAQLDKLAGSVRRGAGEVELKALYESLADAVLAVERTATFETPDPLATARLAALPRAAAPGSVRWNDSCAAVVRVLERLAEADPVAPGLPELRADLEAAADDAALAAVLGRVADRVAAHGADLARERAEAAATLAQVTERLAEMAIYLANASGEQARGHADTQQLNVEVLAQMTRLSDEVRASDDLGALRALVADRLEAVAVNVRDFREREELRYAEHSARTERMKARIVELEGEARALHRSLDLEKRRARLDPLTRIANRASFDERFAEELARFKRFRAPMTLLLWDIDHFKSVNDTCGHRGGDAVLREVATCLARGRRATDFIARLGGEEFVTLLIGTSLADGLRIAEQMRSEVEALPFHFRGSPVRVTISCGATDLRDADSAESAYDRADAALYRAKHEGRNRCVSG